LNPAAAGLTSHAPLPIWVEKHGIFPAGGATGEHLTALLADEHVPTQCVETHDWTRQNLHVHVEASGEQYRFVMPGATLTADEFRRLEEKVLAIESGAILVISGSLPRVLT
jgi:6-phosphofructokinase 2